MRGIAVQTKRQICWIKRSQSLAAVLAAGIGVILSLLLGGMNHVSAPCCPPVIQYNLKVCIHNGTNIEYGGNKTTYGNNLDNPIRIENQSEVLVPLCATSTFSVPTKWALSIMEVGNAHYIEARFEKNPIMIPAFTGKGADGDIMRDTKGNGSTVIVNMYLKTSSISNPGPNFLTVWSESIEKQARYGSDVSVLIRYSTNIPEFGSSLSAVVMAAAIAGFIVAAVALKRSSTLIG